MSVSGADHANKQFLRMFHDSMNNN